MAGLTLGASVLGAHLAGLLAAVPLVIAVMAPATHTRAGASAARAMLRGTVGVVPGTIVFAVLLGATLGVVPSGTAFALAVASLLAVNHAVARLDTALPRKWVKGPREYESQGPFG